MFKLCYSLGFIIFAFHFLLNVFSYIVYNLLLIRPGLY